MDTIKPLFTATATATGGRNGHTGSDDGVVKADLSVPKAMGGPGKPGPDRRLGETGHQGGGQEYTTGEVRWAIPRC